MSAKYNRKTVRKYLAKEDFNIGIPAEEKHASKLDPYKDEIRAMLDWKYKSLISLIDHSLQAI